jgi:hypothetical protein
MWLPEPLSAFGAALAARAPEWQTLIASASRGPKLPNSKLPVSGRATSCIWLAPIEGAALLLRPVSPTLYVPAPDPDAALWTGAVPSFQQLSTDRD